MRCVIGPDTCVVGLLCCVRTSRQWVRYSTPADIRRVFSVNGTCRGGSRTARTEVSCNDVWFREAIRWMKGCTAKNEPFFCYLPTNVPHSPHFVPGEYAAPYRKPGVPAEFFGMIANVDENIGKLMMMLDETGLAEHTILIFMTDNGGTSGVKLFNAGMRGINLDRITGLSC